MLCQKCGERQATFHYKQNVNGKTTQVYLCDHCRREMGIDNFFNQGLDWNEIFGLFGAGHGLGLGSGMLGDSDGVLMRPKPLVCDKCGMRYEDFKNGGRFGCEHCYDVFSNHLEGIMQKLHGSNQHVGRLPDGYESGSNLNEESGETRDATDKENAAGTDNKNAAATDNKNAAGTDKKNSTMKDTEDSVEGEAIDLYELPVSELKKMIRAAVMDEEYEKAATIRDIVRKKEAGDDDE